MNCKAEQPTSSALTSEEQLALGRALVSQLLDADVRELSPLWRAAAEATRRAMRAGTASLKPFNQTSSLPAKE